MTFRQINALQAVAVALCCVMAALVIMIARRGDVAPDRAVAAVFATVVLAAAIFPTRRPVATAVRRQRP